MIKRQQSYYLPPLLLIDSAIANAMLSTTGNNPTSALFTDDLLQSKWLFMQVTMDKMGVNAYAQ